MVNRQYDAVVVGSGPNGLAAAIALQQQRLSVLLLEAAKSVGGGMRTEELTLPGFHHDVCSAVHPLAVDSPFLQSLPLSDHGLEFVFPTHAAVHPMDDGSAAVLHRSVEQTAASLHGDERRYLKIVGRVAADWPAIRNDVLGPFHFPAYPAKMLRFAAKAWAPAIQTCKQFATGQAQALFAGMAAHSMLPLTNRLTSAFALVLMSAGHHLGWPVAKGGSASIAAAMAAYFESIEGTIQSSFPVTSLAQLPAAKAWLFDLTPKQLLTIAGERLPESYKKRLRSYRYGPGVYKIDWALSAPAPFNHPDARMAGTLHLGNSMEEIKESEQATWEGRMADRPFVLFSQPSVFDNTRAPMGKHTAWAYCHTPAGFDQDCTRQIEAQVERYAPGFRETILARHTMNAVQLEQYNSNYVGGDINGGVLDLRQLFTRPVLSLSPYRTPVKGIYICSSSTPPGGGVHGMCGYHAAKRALKDVFGISLQPLG